MVALWANAKIKDALAGLAQDDGRGGAAEQPARVSGGEPKRSRMGARIGEQPFVRANQEIREWRPASLKKW